MARPRNPKRANLVVTTITLPPDHLRMLKALAKTRGVIMREIIENLVAREIYAAPELAARRSEAMNSVNPFPGEMAAA